MSPTLVPDVAIFAAACFVAGLVVVMLRAPLLVESSIRWAQVAMLAAAVVFAAAFTVGSPTPGWTFLLVGVPIGLAFITHYPNLRVLGVMSFRSPRGWSCNNALRVIQFFVKRNWIIDVRSSIFGEPETGRSNCEITLHLTWPTKGGSTQVMRVQRFNSLNQWEMFLYTLGLDPATSPEIMPECSKSGCFYKVRLSRDQVTGLTKRERDMNHNH